MNGNIQKLQAIDEDGRDYRELSSQIKFRQNLVQGIGAATVFGIAAAVGTALFAAAKTALVGGGMMAAAPWVVGLVAIGGLGIGCLYAASKYYAESVRIDQIHQAKQIANGMRGVAPTVEQQRPPSFPAQEPAVAHTPVASLDKAAAALSAVPHTTVTAERALERSAPQAGATVQDKSWTERMAANENQHQPASVRA